MVTVNTQETTMQQNTLEQIRSQIMFGTFTYDEINTILQACQFARAQIARQNIRSVRAGSNVQFWSSKTGKNITGQVTKVGRKFLTVREHGMMFHTWRVPANMVEVV